MAGTGSFFFLAGEKLTGDTIVFSRVKSAWLSGRCVLPGILLFLSLFLAGAADTETTIDPKATVRNIFDRERARLTVAYCLRHYGRASDELREPRMIVVHFTAFPTMDASFRFFAPPRLDVVSRSDIKSGGLVNVSAHYLIDRDGAVVQLAPDNLVCRHTIGFNWTAIGIENVGNDAASLTDAQAAATAALVSRLVARHPSITCLIGHDEYRNSTLPHYRFFREHDRSYRFTDKVDPGPAFMGRVRGLLKERYGLVLQD
jgi:N-acetylmuramoyl-L-alanine amidase